MSNSSLRALLFSGLVFVSGCATAPLLVKASEETKIKESSVKLRRAFDLGVGVGDKDPAFVERLEDLSLDEILRQFYNSYAGAKRMLAFRDQRPDDPLLPIFLTPDAQGRCFIFEDEVDFRSGNFFNTYEKTLFVPFFRQALLQYLEKKTWDDQEFARLFKSLRLAARLTPRWGGVYPNHLEAETGEAMGKYLAEYPSGPIPDRLRFLIFWDERCGAWASRRAALDTELRNLKSKTTDDLLKLEIEDALNSEAIPPERPFWMSLAVPGLGQIASGDLQGGILLGGLTAAAWIWFASKMIQANATDDDATRRVAYGDAGWAGGLAVLGHFFTAYNAAEQARFINITIEWDVLSRPRLR